MSYGNKFYKSIIQSELGKNISNNRLNNILTKSNKNMNTIKLIMNNFDNNKDNNYTNKEVITLLFGKDKSINDIFNYCSSECNIIALNIIENSIPLLGKDCISNLYSIYSSICIGDHVESKYIDKFIDKDIISYFMCVRPYLFIKNTTTVNKRYSYKYNSYISRSLIQIHNQRLLSISDIYYLQFLCDIYKYSTIHSTDTSELCLHINQVISNEEFNINILEKQIKVFNYYYNKSMNRNQLHKILKYIK